MQLRNWNSLTRFNFKPLVAPLFQTRSRRSSNFFGKIMPDSVTDALDPTLHHVLHHAVPAGMKRCSDLLSQREIFLAHYFSHSEMKKIYDPCDSEGYVFLHGLPQESSQDISCLVLNERPHAKSVSSLKNIFILCMVFKILFSFIKYPLLNNCWLKRSLSVNAPGT